MDKKRGLGDRFNRVWDQTMQVMESGKGSELATTMQRQAPCAVRVHCLGCVLVKSSKCWNMCQMARRVRS